MDKSLFSGKRKQNHNKSGKAAEKKQAHREEAEVRNAKYQALSLTEKMKQQKEGGKVWTKLNALKNEQRIPKN